MARASRLALTALLPLAVVAGGSGCDSDGQASKNRPEERGDTLTFRRADGSTIRFPGRVIAWCGAWNDLIPTRALHVAAIGGRSQKQISYWYVWAVPRDVGSGKRVEFPVGFVWNRPRGAEIFVGDLADTAGGTNEASTEEEDSRGWISFAAAGCDPGDPVEFTVDAVVGSEFGDNEPITAGGTFRGRVGEPPPGFSP